MSRHDLRFLLYDWLAVDRLVERERFAAHSRETFDEVLALGEAIAVERFAPGNRIGDIEEPTLAQDGTVRLPQATVDAVRSYLASGLLAAPFDEQVGGHQLPWTVHSAVNMWFQAANAAAFAYPFLAVGNANLVRAHGSPSQVDRFVRPMVEGRWLGTMCLSEPEAGSSLADVRTRAVRQEDGTYRIFGTKMWISAGEHEITDNIVHLVLARTGGVEDGTKGLSLFIVPKWLEDGQRNGVTLAGLNHKMGFRGTTNTVLDFDGAVGEIVGEEGAGLAYMFHMMNEARVAVGAGAVALGYTGYLHSVAYARQRPQGRPVGVRGGPPVPIIAHADVRRMLLTQKSCVEGGLALILYCAWLVDEKATAASPERASALLEVLTPIAKAWPSQWCLHADDLAIQIHGGYGYTRDFPVEQLYRDNRLNPIHEGTNGIQALDLLGRKVSLLPVLLDAMRDTIRRATGWPELAGLSRDLERCVDRVGEVAQRVWAPGDASLALANASAFLEALGHITVAWLWLDQLVAVGSREGDFFEGKRAAARHFFRHLLPAVHPQLDLVESLDTSLLDLDDAVL